MSLDFNIGPYDPCPCGSGAKYKFCCAAKAKDLRHGKFPVGTVALYGPDDQVTTKIAAAVVLENGQQPALERFVSTNVVNDPNVRDHIKRLFAKFGVKSIVVTDRNMGCPHEEGKDFPRGEDCPFCPFWAGKQGTARRDHDQLDDDDDDDQPVAEKEADFEFAHRHDELFGGDDDEEDDQQRPSFIPDPEALARINELLGDKAATLPCNVTGVESFAWEESGEGDDADFAAP